MNRGLLDVYWTIAPIVILAGCAAPVPDDAGMRFSVEHNFLNLDDGIELARKHCSLFGMDAANLANEGNRSSYVCVYR